MSNEGNPRPETANTDPEVHPSPSPGRTLVEDLGELADDLRQMYTDFGLRPYRVWSVTYRWTGGGIGLGEMVLASETEMLPTPKFTTTVKRKPQDAGYVERGDAKLREISPRYTEDQVRSLFHREPLPKGFQGFIEVRIDERDGNAQRRRFTVSDVPYRDAEKFEWVATLTKQDADRDRAGRVIPIDRGG